MKTEPHGINPDVPPSGEGCFECIAAGGWWLHLRRCTECGHVGCCIVRLVNMPRSISTPRDIRLPQVLNPEKLGFMTIGLAR